MNCFSSRASVVPYKYNHRTQTANLIVTRYHNLNVFQVYLHVSDQMWKTARWHCCCPFFIFAHSLTIFSIHYLSNDLNNDYIMRLSIEDELLLYKAILKSIWFYGVQLWGTASNSNIEMLQRFQNKYLRIIVNAVWYASPMTLCITISTLERD